MKKFINSILFMGLLASPARAEGDRHEQIRKLQVMSRVFQICFGRAIKKEEAQRVLPMNKSEIVEYILATDELTAVYASRLVNFAKGGESSSNTAALEVPGSVKMIARPDSPLDAVLKNLENGRHQGVACGGKSNSACFARWLVARVAPALGEEWVTKNEGAMGTWTYAKLLEQMSLSSI